MTNTLPPDLVHLGSRLSYVIFKYIVYDLVNISVELHAGDLLPCLPRMITRALVCLCPC